MCYQIVFLFLCAAWKLFSVIVTHSACSPENSRIMGWPANLLPGLIVQAVETLLQLKPIVFNLGRRKGWRHIKRLALMQGNGGERQRHHRPVPALEDDSPICCPGHG